MLDEGVYKIVLGKPKGASPYKRVDILRNGDLFQASMFGQKKVFHKNMDFDEADAFVEENLGKNFMQMNSWDEDFEHQVKVSKKGKIFSTKKAAANPPKKPIFERGFDRQKNHVIKEGDKVQALVDLGIFTKEYKVAAQKRDKFVQINRFLEIIGDALDFPKKMPKTNIIDFGCGKSYLTFLVHHYFAAIKKHVVEICGLDENSETVEKCRDIVKKACLENIRFQVGDIESLKEPPIFEYGNSDCLNIAISLHACDLATDFAILNAVRWKSDLIFVAPCCQHELSKQMQPKNLTVLSEYGIIKERFASLATDVLRAKYLEYMGYAVQLLDFTEKEHTDKNLMIRAKKTGKRNGRVIHEVKLLCREFGFSPTILNNLWGDFNGTID